MLFEVLVGGVCVGMLRDKCPLCQQLHMGYPA